MNLQTVLIFSLLCFVKAIFYDDLVLEEWEKFKFHHNKQYETEIDEKRRMEIFTENYLKIAAHNDLYEKGIETYSMGMNEFGDMTQEEFLNTMTMHGFNYTETSLDDEPEMTFIPPDVQYYPRYIDWRKKGAVTRVKAQLLCGACWAFSTTGALEGQIFRKTGRLVSLSEQNLVDCASAFGPKGCHGGWPSDAFMYIKKNRGIDTEKSYPYRGNKGYCGYKKKYSGGYDKGFMRIPQSEYKLKKAVATKGPISVVVDATNMQLYKHGIYYDKNCGNKVTDLNHAVLVVGYGYKKHGGSYWLIKNSWGAKWGEKGYLKLARKSNNHCGVTTKATVPLV